jgi:ribosomal protein L40E
MKIRFRVCLYCGRHNNPDAQGCQDCGSQYTVPTVAPKAKNNMLLIIAYGVLFLTVAALMAVFMGPSSGRNANRTSSATPTPATAALSAERMVLDDAQVSVYVECTHREWKQYKFRFIVKNPGSPLLAPILRQAGNPRAYSVVVNGVDTGDDFAFSPKIEAFDKNGEIIDTTFVSRPLNGDVALGYAYHDLVVKYERGN